MSVFRAIHLLLPLAAAAFATDAQAQGKGKGKHDEQERVIVVQQGHAKPHKGRKLHTSDEAVEVTRVVLREQGYDLVRVERRGDVRVVYYRRGNMGRGRGKGPIMYMVVRPSPDRIIIERAPSPLRVQINVRLGY
ncbi:MAG: hypothetical protein ABR499_00335 [Gemmatimonadaceae bacterium]